MENINFNKKKFELTWKLTDHINSTLPEVSRYRTKWAFLRFFRECFPYLFWLILLIACALHNTGGNSRGYLFSKNIETRFVENGFLEIASIGDFWDWHQQVFIPSKKIFFSFSLQSIIESQMNF